MLINGVSKFTFVKIYTQIFLSEKFFQFDTSSTFDNFRYRWHIFNESLDLYILLSVPACGNSHFQSANLYTLPLIDIRSFMAYEKSVQTSILKVYNFLFYVYVQCNITRGRLFQKDFSERWMCFMLFRTITLRWLSI